MGINKMDRVFALPIKYRPLATLGSLSSVALSSARRRKDNKTGGKGKRLISQNSRRHRLGLGLIHGKRGTAYVNL